LGLERTGVNTSNDSLMCDVARGKFIALAGESEADESNGWKESNEALLTANALGEKGAEGNEEADVVVLVEEDKGARSEALSLRELLPTSTVERLL